MGVNTVAPTYSEPISKPLTADPVYYSTAAIFALLTTTLPAGLGQPRFLPIAQALALTVFLAVPLRAGRWRDAARVMAVWLVVVLLAMSVLSYLFPQQIQSALVGGFTLRTDLVAWVSGVSEFPGSMRADPRAGVIELVGVGVGAIVSAGLVGNWFLMRAVNATGFSTGILVRAIATPPGVLLSIPIWNLAKIFGLAGFVILLSQPLLIGHWSLRYYLESQRTLIGWSAILLVLGLVLGILIQPLWQSVIAAFIQ